jgi:hypothetical protein
MLPPLTAKLKGQHAYMCWTKNSGKHVGKLQLATTCKLDLMHEFGLLAGEDARFPAAFCFQIKMQNKTVWCEVLSKHVAANFDCISTATDHTLRGLQIELTDAEMQLLLTAQESIRDANRIARDALPTGMHLRGQLAKKIY